MPETFPGLSPAELSAHFNSPCPTPCHTRAGSPVTSHEKHERHHDHNRGGSITDGEFYDSLFLSFFFFGVGGSEEKVSFVEDGAD